MLFGGELLDPSTHQIPAVYGSFQPTAIYVPLDQLLKPENFGLCTTEIFGPFQVVTSYNDSQLDSVLQALEVLMIDIHARCFQSVILWLLLCRSVENGPTFDRCDCLQGQ